MIDTHAHIDSDDFDTDRDKVIGSSFAEGIEAIIVPAIEPAKFESTYKLTTEYEKIFAAIGIHPHSANAGNEESYQKIIDYTKKDKVIAIGEIGLDYYYDFSPKDVQKKVFRRQLQIAKDSKLPVIIHNRDSEDDLLQILNEEQDGSLRGVMHCFYGSTDYLQRVLDLGMHVSFTGNITFKKFENQEIIKLVPTDRFMIETDSPYMTPVPFRGKRNEPKYVKYIAEKIAELKSINIEEVIHMTSINAKKLFNLTLVVLFFIAAGMNASYAQEIQDTLDIDGEISQEYGRHTKPYNHFKKTLGIGFVLGTNTIVESYKPDPQDLSYEGLVALGGTIQGSPFDFLVISASYVYSKNEKLLEKFPFLKPNKHQQIELTAHFLVNPRNKINFYAMGGPSMLLNEYGLDNGLVDNQSRWGVNAGLGFFINLPVEGAGMFAIQAEWKLNFMIGKTDRDFDPRYNREDPTGKFYRDTEVETFFSIPRLNLMWYPDLF